MFMSKKLTCHEKREREKEREWNSQTLFIYSTKLIFSWSSFTKIVFIRIESSAQIHSYARICAMHTHISVDDCQYSWHEHEFHRNYLKPSGRAGLHTPNQVVFVQASHSVQFKFTALLELWSHFVANRENRHYDWIYNPKYSFQRTKFENKKATWAF